jgi:hypothetical protein
MIILRKHFSGVYINDPYSKYTMDYISGGYYSKLEDKSRKIKQRLKNKN